MHDRRFSMSAPSKVDNLVPLRPRAADADADATHYVAGEVIASKYQLERLLGTGGMGAVWRARNLTLDADVAIKLIRRDVTANGAATRLLREARAAARLEHPSIVRVFDFGETERGDPFIVMEEVRGESLAELVDRKGRIDATAAVQLLLPIVDALSVVHARGIVHRDVKPDNVILVADAKGHIVPKLVDFGIAKDAPHEGLEPIVAADRVPRRRPLTQIGVLMGSPEYMAPEQAAGSAGVDAAADIWAVSVVLYELLSGRRPFEGDDLEGQLIQIISAEPPSLLDRGVADEVLWSIIARGLEKDPPNRWPSMRALGCALAEWLIARGVRADVSGADLESHWQVRSAPQSPPSPSAPAVSRRNPRAAITAALVAAVGGAGLAFFLLLPAPALPRLEARFGGRLPALPMAPRVVVPPPVPPSTARDTLDVPAPSPAPPIPHAAPRKQAAPDDPGF
jgi:eukaryotic-like serine/threonine-protein kinase